LRLAAADGLYFAPIRGGHHEASRRAVTIVLPLPGGPTLKLKHLLLDVNGTLSDRGVLHEGVAPRVGRLRALLEVQLVTADTFGTATGIAEVLGVGSRRVSNGAEKRELVERLGRDRCAVIGNGANDMLALHAAALGIAVMGREG
jgi:soluble P-type ATPase